MRAVALLAVFAGCASTPLAAQQARVQTSITAAEAADLVRAQGYRAEIETRSNGQPMISFEVSGRKTVIFLQRCTNNRCSDMYLYAGFKVDRAPSLTAINDWNRERRFSRAYIDKEGDPVIEADFDFDGGNTLGNAKEWMATWKRTLDAFVKHIGFD